MRNKNDVLTEVGKQTFLKVVKSQIHEFSVSFCCRQSAHFLGMQVRKSQTRKFLQKNTYCITTLSQDSPISCIYAWFFHTDM